MGTKCALFHACAHLPETRNEKMRIFPGAAPVMIEILMYGIAWLVIGCGIAWIIGGASGHDEVSNYDRTPD